MRNKRLLLILIILFLGIAIYFFIKNPQDPDPQKTTPKNTKTQSEKIKEQQQHPMAIENLREKEYPGSDFVIEEELPNGSNHQRFIASYKSEELKIYGLLTVPLSQKPENGFPAIVFIHGYIPPKEYSTINDYPTYQARLANSDFITFKPDLRGHGKSEGEAVGTHYSEKYVIDTLFAISYLKNHPSVNPEKIGYWGHSNGGKIGLQTAVISSDIKAFSLWAGVVGSYEDMLETYNDKINFLQNADKENLVIENGFPSENPDFWNKLDPYFYLENIQAPIELQHGTADKSVPVELSRRLQEELKKASKTVEYHEYSGDDHNIGNNVNLAFNRTIDFYNKYLNQPETATIHQPIDNASNRITKKPFGIKIDPETSPVQPERFSGYHTGTDFEIFPEEENSEVNALSICEGPLLQKRQTSGYGGIAIQKCNIKNQPVTVIYGHLDLESISKNPGEDFQPGEKIAVLGQGFTSETDGERKHLHLGIHLGESISLLGYVENQSALSSWLDYENLIK
jgi:dienelactone hydrolase